MKGKVKKLNYILGLEIYPFDIMFSFGQTDDELKKSLSKFDLTEADIEAIKWRSDTNLGRCVMFSNNANLIRMRAIPVLPKEFAILQHEIFHAVHFILDHIGMPLTDSSNEAYTYLTEFITKNIYTEIFKTTIKKKK